MSKRKGMPMAVKRDKILEMYHTSKKVGGMSVRLRSFLRECPALPELHEY